MLAHSLLTVAANAFCSHGLIYREDHMHARVRVSERLINGKSGIWAQ